MSVCLHLQSLAMNPNSGSLLHFYTKAKKLVAVVSKCLGVVVAAVCINMEFCLLEHSARAGETIIITWLCS